MVHDILPDLLNEVKDKFEAEYGKSAIISSAIDQLKKNKANYGSANAFAIEVGEILAEALSSSVTGDKLPDGKMYYNIGQRLLTDVLGRNHELVSDYTSQVQKQLNLEAEIGLKVQVPGLNQDRLSGIINRLSYEESFEEVDWLLSEPIINFTQAIVDDFVKLNVDSQASVGLSPKIIRKQAGRCCKWCSNLVGTHTYGEEPEMVWHRHRYCRCTVEYFSKGLKSKYKSNVHTKNKELVNRSDRIRIKRSETKERSLNNARLKRIAVAKAKELGLKPTADNRIVDVMRRESDKWIEKLNEFEKRSISKYTDNGTDSDGLKLFQKLNGYIDGYYNPLSDTEEEMILQNIENIQLSLLKNKIEKDIIVYRNEVLPEKLTDYNRFLSTSVTQTGALGKKPNVAIIVPSGHTGGYVEKLSNYPKQREFLLPQGTQLEEVFTDSELKIFVAKGVE